MRRIRCFALRPLSSTIFSSIYRLPTPTACFHLWYTCVVGFTLCDVDAIWLLSLFAPLWGSEKAGRLAIGGCTPCDNRDIVETSHGKGLQSRNKPNACVQMADDPMVDTYEQYE